MRRHHRRHKKSTLKKRVNKIAKELKKSEVINYEITSTAGVPAVATWLGTASNSTLDTNATTFNLTSLAQGLGPQMRLTNKVQFKRAIGTINVSLPATSTFAGSGNNLCKLFIVKFDKMPGTASAHTYPLINELFTVNNPVAVSDIFVEPNNNFNLNDRKPQWKVIAARTFTLCVAPTVTNHLSIKAKADRKILRSKDAGVATSFTFDYDIDLSKMDISTYDGAGNSVATENENHLAAFIWVEGAFINNVPLVQHNEKLIYVNV